MNYHRLLVGAAVLGAALLGSAPAAAGSVDRFSIGFRDGHSHLSFSYREADGAPYGGYRYGYAGPYYPYPYAAYCDRYRSHQHCYWRHGRQHCYRH